MCGNNAPPPPPPKLPIILAALGIYVCMLVIVLVAVWTCLLLFGCLHVLLVVVGGIVNAFLFVCSFRFVCCLLFCTGWDYLRHAWYSGALLGIVVGPQRESAGCCWWYLLGGEEFKQCSNMVRVWVVLGTLFGHFLLGNGNGPINAFLGWWPIPFESLLWKQLMPEYLRKQRPHMILNRQESMAKCEVKRCDTPDSRISETRAITTNKHKNAYTGF